MLYASQCHLEGLAHSSWYSTTPLTAVPPRASWGKVAATSLDQPALLKDIPGLLVQISDRLEKMRVYAQMLGVLPAWRRWQAIEEETATNPKSVVRKLIDSHAFAVARRWAVLHGVSENEIEENYLLNLLDTDGRTLESHQVFFLLFFSFPPFFFCLLVFFFFCDMLFY